MDFVAAGPVSFGYLEGSSGKAIRTRRHVADGNGDFQAIFMHRAWQDLTYRGETKRIAAGQFCLTFNGLPSEVAYPDAAATAIRIDGAALRTLVRRPEDAGGRALSVATVPALGLLSGYLRAFGSAESALSPEHLHGFGLHLLDLVAWTVGASRDGAAQAESGGVRAARLRQLLDTIAERACDPDFAVEAVAARLAVTTRYINRLLEETGASFSEHVAEHRLRRAWRLLCDPNCALKIASVAFEAGFNDLSTFNRAFRRHFGETPSAVRGAARTPPPERKAGGGSLLYDNVVPFLAPSGRSAR
jgi:AraC-like DNA-binding protein